MSYELRPHQVDARASLVGSFRMGNKRPIVQAPTGSGKTLLSIDIIKSALEKGTYVIFVVDRITLLDQTSREFGKHGIEHGVIQADHWRTNNLRVQIASVQTLVRRKDKPRAGLIIVDECHSTFKSFTKLITEGEYKDVKVIGLSATPFTKGLGKTYDDLVVISTTAELMEKGFLCGYTAYSAPISLKGLKTVAGDYNQKQLGERVSKSTIVGNVVSTWLRLGENRQTVCFAVSVAHSEAIVDEFKANGVTAEHIDAYTEPEERDAIFERHANGETKIISNVGITTKGWDSPNTDCLILARPTKSLMLYLQMVGRVLRVADNRSTAIILDHGANIERLGFPDDPLPDYLCMGEKGDIEKKKKEAEEKTDKLPKPCEKCTHLSTEFICPKCGHKPEKVPKVDAVEGELKKMEKVPMAEKQKWYGMLLGHARKSGYSDGWADHKYKERYGVWMNKKSDIVATTPDSEVAGWIKHKQIAFSKSRKPAKKKSAHSSPQDGFTYKAQTTSDGRKMVKVTKQGKYICFAPQTDAILAHIQKS